MAIIIFPRFELRIFFPLEWCRCLDNARTILWSLLQLGLETSTEKVPLVAHGWMYRFCIVISLIKLDCERYIFQYHYIPVHTLNFLSDSKWNWNQIDQSPCEISAQGYLSRSDTILKQPRGNHPRDRVAQLPTKFSKGAVSKLLATAYGVKTIIQTNMACHMRRLFVSIDLLAFVSVKWMWDIWVCLVLNLFKET